jgi:ATP-binding cassette subfamily B protein
MSQSGTGTAAPTAADAPRGLAPEEILGKAYDARLMRRVWSFVRPHGRLLLVAVLLMPIAVAFELCQPYLVKIAIDDHIAAGKLAGLGGVALIFMACVLLQALASYAELYALNLLGQRSMRDLRIAVYGHVLRQRAAFFDRMPVGRLLTRMTSDVESINEMFAAGVVTLAVDLLKLLAILVMMFALNAELAAITLLFLPPLAATVEYARRLMRRSFRLIRVKLAEMNAYLAEHLAGIKVVQIFTRETAARREFDRINRDHRDAYLEAIRGDVSLYALVEALGVVAVAAIAWHATGEIGEGALTVGLIVAFIEYVNKAFIPIRDLSAKYTVMQSAMAATERIVSLLDSDEPDAPVRVVEPAARSIAPRPDAPALECRDVHFAYRAEEEILGGLSFSVPRGQTVAVVGPTGSGKSTIIKLLTRLYEPTAGEILAYGQPLAEIPAAAMRARVAVVSQDVFLFAGTVAENVLLGDADASPAALARVVERVGLDGILLRRRATLEERVAERGANFSAGERQLIAFARALLRDPDILILDEATAHVDPETERAVERGLAELMRGRTSLVVAHRLSTVQRADTILVVTRGRIVERGTAAELAAAGGVYARLAGTLLR